MTCKVHGIHPIRPVAYEPESAGFSWSFWILLILLLSLIIGWPLSCSLSSLSISSSSQAPSSASVAAGSVQQVTDLSTVLPPTAPTVLLLYSSGCQHCMRFMPTFSEVAGKYAGKPVLFYRGHFSDVKAATAPDLLDQLMPIPGLPIVFVFPASGPPTKLIGDMKADDFYSKLQVLLNQ